MTFSASVKVDGEPAKPSKVTCAAKLGGKKAKAGTARAATGPASCRYATKKTDKGKTLAGSMRVTAERQVVHEAVLVEARLKRAAAIATLAVATLAVSSGALGRSAVDDLAVTVVLQGAGAGATPIAGPAFGLSYLVETDGPVQTVTMRTTIPDGLRVAPLRRRRRPGARGRPRSPA